MFTSEEPTRFKLSCVGSRAMAGALGADVLDVKLDENGTNFKEVSFDLSNLPVSHVDCCTVLLPGIVAMFSLFWTVRHGIHKTDTAVLDQYRRGQAASCVNSLT